MRASREVTEGKRSKGRMETPQDASAAVRYSVRYFITYFKRFRGVASASCETIYVNDGGDDDRIRIAREAVTQELWSYYYC